MKNILAFIVAFFAGGAVVAIGTLVGSWIHPLPDGIDMADAEQLNQHALAAPFAAKVAVVASWAMGGLAAGFVARLLAKEKSMVPGCIVLFIFSLATVVQLVSIPSPVWMWLAGIAAFPVFGIIGMSLVPGCDQNVSTVRMIAAPLSVVFNVISRPDGFKAAVPGIQHIEFLSASHSGVGTRFVETRQMNGREAKAELEVTELNDNERVRIVSDMGGTVWDTLFCVRVVDEQVELTMSMDARPHNFIANLMTPMILPMVSKAVESDMDAVKKYCEKKVL